MFLAHFILAVALSQGVVAGDALHGQTGVFEQAFHTVEYTYPTGR